VPFEADQRAALEALAGPDAGPASGLAELDRLLA
jgi:hypothetical protein